MNGTKEMLKITEGYKMRKGSRKRKHNKGHLWKKIGREKREGKLEGSKEGRGRMTVGRHGEYDS